MFFREYAYFEDIKKILLSYCDVLKPKSYYIICLSITQTFIVLSKSNISKWNHNSQTMPHLSFFPVNIIFLLLSLNKTSFNWERELEASLLIRVYLPLNIRYFEMYYSYFLQCVAASVPHTVTVKRITK